MIDGNNCDLVFLRIYLMKEVVVKSILNKKKKRDSWFLDDYTLNPYGGCSFNCQYCYIRGSKYGENMAETLAVKINGAEVLDRQLGFRSKKDQHGIIALASATDPYIKAEEKYRLTESFLKLILKHRFPVMIITKSTLVTRDIQLLSEIDKNAIHANDLRERIKGGVAVSFSLSTIDADLAATLEPGAPPPIERLRAMQCCKDAGLKVGVNCMPILPFVSDSDDQLDLLVKTAKQFGADYIFIGGLTLFGDQPADSRTLYYKFLERRFPHLRKDYKKLYRIFFAPSKTYLADLERKASAICNKYTIRRSILEL